MNETLHLLGVADIAARTDFPPPVATVNGGRMRIWALADIEAFACGKPKLGDPAAKKSKAIGYPLARQRVGT